MAKNVRFVRTTKEKWLTRDTYDPLALYFCEDTQEMCKGDQVLTDGIRVVPTKADLPACPFAADGVIYYIAETKSGYMMSPDRSEWLQTIYAPVADVSSIPAGEEYNVVTTVGAVRDIETAIYAYIDREIANVEGGSGTAGKDGISIVKTEINSDGELVLTFSDESVVNVGKVVGENGRDGASGKDGVNGQNGLSAYEIWLNNGHAGTEAEFLDSLKGESELLDTFGDVVTSIGCDGIAAGTSLKGKTIKDVLVMLLGIKDAPKTGIDFIIENSMPFYSGLDGSGDSMIEYKQLDPDTADYTDQGFYVTTNSDGEITRAGYQITFEENTDEVAQTFAVCQEAKIVAAYQYQPALNQWLDMGFDGTFWIENGTETKVVNGQTVTYTTYIYNAELMGDVITTPEHWRFEVEVL